MKLWTAEGDPAGFSALWRSHKSRLEHLGYSWTGLFGPLVPCCWQLPEPADAEVIRGEIEAALAAVAAERAERARIAAEIEAADLARVAIEAAPIRTALAAVVADRPWLCGRNLAEARELVEEASWQAWQMRAAERLIANAEASDARAEARIRRGPRSPRCFELAQDPAVRSAALQACRLLSERDTDWAAIRNSQGWSQTTTWAGHALSERKELTVAEAAYALELLWGHKKQLTDSLRLALWGQAENAPEPALALQASLQLAKARTSIPPRPGETRPPPHGHGHGHGQDQGEDGASPPARGVLAGAGQGLREAHPPPLGHRG
jgi:hypothetical protein